MRRRELPLPRRVLTPKLEAFVRSPQFGRMWRYGAVSVVSTLTTLALLAIFLTAAHISAFWSNVLATTIATVPSYYLNRNWAWGKSGKSHLTREVMPFWVIAAIGLVLSTVAVDHADKLARDSGLGHGMVTLVVLAANFATYAVIWVGKFILFNKVLFADRTEGLVDLYAEESLAEISNGARAERQPVEHRS